MVVTEPDVGEASIDTLITSEEIKIKEMHIIYAPSETVLPPLSETKESIVLARYKIKALRNVEMWCEKIENAGIEVKGVEIIFGGVINHVLNVEKTVEPQLIVIAGKKLKKLYGEDLRDIVHKSKADVLISRIESVYDLFERVVYLHVIFDTVDKLGDKLMNWLSGIKSVTAVHVVSPVLPPEVSTKKMREERKMAENSLRKLKELLIEMGVEMNYEIRLGSLSDEVVEVIGENDATALIIGGYESKKKEIDEIIDLIEIPVILLK